MSISRLQNGFHEMMLTPTVRNSGAGVQPVGGGPAQHSRTNSVHSNLLSTHHRAIVGKALWITRKTSSVVHASHRLYTFKVYSKLQPGKR